MRHARSIPLALFVACLVAATPVSWGAGDRAAAAGESQRKPAPIAHRVLDVVDFVAGLASIPRGLVPVRAIEDLILDGDVGLSLRDLGDAARLAKKPSQPCEPKPCDPFGQAI